MAEATNGNGNGNGELPARREFQFLLAGAFGLSLLVQALLMWRLMAGNPPDASWALIQDLMKHLGILDVGLMGGLLGMAQRRGP